MTAWIEIDCTLDTEDFAAVAVFMTAWIEIAVDKRTAKALETLQSS